MSATDGARRAGTSPRAGPGDKTGAEEELDRRRDEDRTIPDSCGNPIWDVRDGARDEERRVPDRRRVPGCPAAGVRGTDTCAMHGSWASTVRLLAAPLLAVAIAGLQLAAIGTLSPQIVTDLGGADLYVYIVLAYLVASVAGAAVAVVLAPRLPTLRIVAIAMVVLAAGLLVSGLAPSMAIVVVGRAVSGIGAGLAFAVAPAFVHRVPHEQRSVVGGAVAAAFAITFVASPAVGGLITQAFGWRSALLLGIPVAAVAFVLALGRDATRVAVIGEPSPPGSRGTSVAAVLAAGCAGAAGFVALVFVPLANSATGNTGVGAGAADAVVFAIGVLLAGVAWAWPPSRDVVRLPVGSAVILFFGLAALSLSELAGGPVPTSVALIVAGLGVALSLAAFAGDGRDPEMPQAAGFADGNPRSGSPDGRAGLISVATRQAGGLVGLGIAGALFIITWRDRLVGDLRTVLEFAMLAVPAQSRAEVRAAAEAGLASLASGFDPSFVANIGRTFAEQMLLYVPLQYQSMVQPYMPALNTVFANAARHGLAAAFGSGAALALIAVVIGAISAAVARSRQVAAG